jgi:2-iminobutanoate/2-iminopropanoate deaminase
MTRRAIEPAGLADAAQHHFTPAIVANGTLYVSGQVGTDDEGAYVGDDVRSQTRRAFENVEVLLRSVDRGLGDVVKVTSYVVDIADNYEAFHSVYREVFPERPFPCHTALGVDSLASETPLVEVEVEAVVDGNP